MKTITVPDWMYEPLVAHIAKLRKNRKLSESLERMFKPMRERHEEATRNGCVMVVGDRRCGSELDDYDLATYCPRHAPLD